MPSNTSKNYKTFPKVSIIIPTLNSATVLPSCLKSILNQTYLNIEILICDGGSTDKTLVIAKKYNAIIIKNKLKTAEAGKAIGLKKARGKYIAFIDSDNILPTANWMSEMVKPLESDSTLIGSEPWEFTYRQKAGFIERYSALIGANDPYAYVTGISDRKNVITNQWTTIKTPQTNYQNYIKVQLNPNQPIPTIGANGTVFRGSFIKQNFTGDYIFDIDTISQILNKTQKSLYFAKTKNGIIHTWCESSISKFYRKQIRRLKDYYTYKQIRKFNYQNDFTQNKLNNIKILIINNFKFVFYTILILPMVFTTVLGFIKKPDLAWFFHPIACLITLYCYLSVSILYLLGFNISQSRQQWSQ